MIAQILRNRSSLKVVVMSATLEAEKFQGYFTDAPLMVRPYTKEGRQGTVQRAVRAHESEGSRGGDFGLLCFVWSSFILVHARLP